MTVVVGNLCNAVKDQTDVYVKRQKVLQQNKFCLIEPEGVKREL